MAFEIVLEPTIAGLSFAAVAVVAGAPVFSEGLRALRLARGFRGLRRSPPGGADGDLSHVRGVVALESPLFSPLAGVPCAGFRLEIRGPRGPVARPIDVFRPFQISDGDSVARVIPDGGRFELAQGAIRRLEASDVPSQNLAALIDRTPEVAWLRRGGATLTLTERVLGAGVAVHVIGTASYVRLPERMNEDVLERTGTDDVAVVADRRGRDHDHDQPLCSIEAGVQLDYLLVADREPAPEHLRVSRLRIAGVFVGPALSLGGLLMLANAADRLRALGG